MPSPRGRKVARYAPRVPSRSKIICSADATCGLAGGRDNALLPLAPLASNGGYTQTHTLSKGSAAVDAGTGQGCPSTDQRAIGRPQGAACDVGAVEMRPQDYRIAVYLPATVR